MITTQWRMENEHIHRELNIPLVSDEIKKMATQNEERLPTHSHN